jgi:aspartyl-tRNA synthetase
VAVDLQQSTAPLETLEGWRRSHNCGDLTAAQAGQEVLLMGWVHRRRDHGNVIFIDLRDRFGITQIVFDPQIHRASHQIAEHLRTESVVAIKGNVRQRPAGMANADLKTGEIEVMVTTLKLLSRAENPPFAINEDAEVSEIVRFKYRYLDLRRDHLQKNLVQRARIVQLFRSQLEKHGFTEFETPYLYKSTPEGAREFLVPARMHPGQFYALPQSPQLFKQLLMISGFDRYYQVVRCFRDEDLRADRQPEFTQVDCELSFADAELAMQTFEGVMRGVYDNFFATKLPPFKRLSFDEAMARYGSDKPDLRFGLPIVEVSEQVRPVEFRVFADALKAKGSVHAIVVPDGAESLTRKDLDDLTAVAVEHGAKGMAWAKKSAGTGIASWASPIAKFLTDSVISAIEAATDLKPGGLILFGAGPRTETLTQLGQVRLKLGTMLDLRKPDQFEFCWVHKFPLWEKDKRSGRWVSCHHPFTLPLEQDIGKLESDPEAVRASAYDMVLNGNEIAGGSIRIHDPALQRRVFKMLGLSEEEITQKFGFLLQALSYGAPPHGGIAFGLDRLVMCLLGAHAIRDVIAFPKTQKGSCLMTESPAAVGFDQLSDLHIRLKGPN